MRKDLVVALVLLFALGVAPAVSAEIIISQPKVLYNVGDEFIVDITLRPGVNTQGFAVADLICDNGEVEIYKSPENLLEGEAKGIAIRTNLDSFLVGDLLGDCYLQAMFGNEEVRSQGFEISSFIDVSLDIKGVNFGPDDEVVVTGSATKVNDFPLEGFVEVEIVGLDEAIKSGKTNEEILEELLEDVEGADVIDSNDTEESGDEVDDVEEKLEPLNFTFVGPVVEGKFEVKFNIPANARPGEYDIKARAYEKDSAEEVINEGESVASFRIKQVIKEIDIALNSPNIRAEEELVYAVLMYNQASEEVEEEVGVIIYKPERDVFSKGIIQSGESQRILIEKNYNPGYWKIEAKTNDLEVEKLFYVEEFEDVSFVLENDTLIVTNIGNVMYDRPLEISIGDVNELKDVKLGVGDTKIFVLSAPDGSYLVEVTDGDRSENFGNTLLTGRAISIKELGDFFGNNWVVLIWLLVIVILGIVVVFVYKKIRRGNFVGKIPQGLKKAVKFKKLNDIKPPVMAKPENQKISSKAVQNVIESGSRERVNVVSLKIKNNRETVEDKKAAHVLNKVLLNAKNHGGKVYVDGDYRIVVFAPVLTKEIDNTMRSVSVAKAIERMLKAYNKSAHTKIDFGIGTHIGEMVVEQNRHKFKFTSIGGVIINAKRAAEAAVEAVLATEPLHGRIVGKVKTKRTGRYWEVMSIPKREDYEEFIHNFLERIKSD